MKPAKRRYRLTIDVLEDRVAPAVFWVVTSQDNNQGGLNPANNRNEGSFRWAIAQANAANANDQIRFAIPGAAPFNIVLDPLLPDLVVNCSVTISGSDQLGNNGLPGIKIDGNGHFVGLYLQGPNCSVSSLAITNCSRAEIVVQNTTGVQLTSDLIGIDSAGNVSGGQAGVKLENSSGAYIGNAAGRNVIAGNDTNVWLDDSSNNYIQRNYIGTNLDGSAGAASQRGTAYGVKLDNGSNSNEVGGFALTPGTGLGNVIANASSADVGIYNNSDNNQVHGNLIGLDNTGQRAIGHAVNDVDVRPTVAEDGSSTTCPLGNMIGGSNLTDRNIIAGAVGAGIEIGGAGGGTFDTTVESNYIGTNIGGTQPIPNGAFGVTVSGNGNVIGDANLLGLPDGIGLPPGNLISGNTAGGVLVTGGDSGQWNATDNKIKGNIIGPDYTATRKLGPQFDGIKTLGTGSLQIGGSGIGDGNVISGNDTNGINMSAGSGPTSILGNFIGTNKLGLFQAGLGNGTGIFAADEFSLTIGGARRNIISGNRGNGITQTNGSSTIQANYIGVDANGGALPNNGDGISFSATRTGRAATIGGTTSGTGNVISANGGEGIAIKPGTNDQGAYYSVSVAIQGNIIGLDPGGTLGMGNGLNGIHVSGAAGVQIGGDSIQAGNLISANFRNGLLLDSGAAQTLIKYNSIGTDTTGNSCNDWLNGRYGIAITDGCSGTVLRKNRVAAGSQLGALPASAISVDVDNSIGTDARQNIFRNTVRIHGAGAMSSVFDSNAIGVDANGNPFDDGVSDAGDGILISDGSSSNSVTNNLIKLAGGTGLDDETGLMNTVAGNTIGFCAQSGIRVVGGVGDWISTNTVNNNGSNGIYINIGGAPFAVYDNEGAGEAGVWFRWMSMGNVYLGDNSVTYNGLAGIDLVNGVGIGIYENTLSENATAGLVLENGLQIAVYNNVANGNGAQGIYSVNAGNAYNSMQVAFVQNVTTGNLGAGIQVDGGVASIGAEDPVGNYEGTTDSWVQNAGFVWVNDDFLADTGPWLHNGGGLWIPAALHVDGTFFINGGWVDMGGSDITYIGRKLYIESGGKFIVDSDDPPTIQGDVVNSGILQFGNSGTPMAPGNPDAGNMLEIIGNYIQTATGRFLTADPGWGEANLSVTGNATLDGTFTCLVLHDGADQTNVYVVFIDCASITGQFAAYQIPDSFIPRYGPDPNASNPNNIPWSFYLQNTNA